MSLRFYKITAARWAATLARTLLVQLRGVGPEGGDATSEPVDDAEVFQPAGLRANPVLRATTEGVAVEVGDERVVLVIVDKSRQIGSVEPETGGTTLHGLAEQSAVVYIRANGDIEITPATGRNVILAGGTLAAARTTDQVQVTIPMGAVIIAASGGTPNPGPITLTGTITGAGAPQVKA